MPAGARPSLASLARRGDALVSEGLIDIKLMLNDLVFPVAAPDEIQAIDAYPIRIIFWGPSGAGETQRAESREFFDRLISSLPQTSALLLNGVDILVRAYLVGVGAHDFPDHTTIDFPDLETWAPWVIRK
ncbi:MAG: hypothetical protein JWM19_1875 [Actinomycetia bacterium]|nr:hypothetical protein [Actinomycetes bacterium]